jgi:hypothetical protein
MSAQMRSKKKELFGQPDLERDRREYIKHELRDIRDSEAIDHLAALTKALKKKPKRK